MRIALVLSYNGSEYNGWQVQPNGITIQQKLEEVLTSLNQNKKVDVLGCGRTDTGVHAEQFLAHSDVPAKIAKESELQYKLNVMLPKDIAVRSVVPVDEDFHARFDAIKRSYIYRIHTRKDPFLLHRSWYISHPLNIDAMQEACKFLRGKKDFQCFSKSNTQVNNYICEVTEAFFKIDKDQLHFYISANRFLRNMVRAIVGTLIEVGERKRNPEDVDEIIASMNRSNAGKSAPAEGLYLSEVVYPDFTTNDYF